MAERRPRWRGGLALLLLLVGLWGGWGTVVPPSPEVPPEVCRAVQALHFQAQALTRWEPAAADALARSLGYSDQAAASLMCVPLSAEVLRRAGLLSVAVEPARFWLLDPQREPRKVQRLFPERAFAHYAFTTPPFLFDFRQFPLIPGDVVYLYSGRLGTFSHMLAVTYVDRAGRAYGLSNLNTPHGYIVREVLLYDPARPGVGQLARWNDPRWARLGLTGFGGWEVWRPRRWLPYADALARGACAQPPQAAWWLAAGGPQADE